MSHKVLFVALLVMFALGLSVMVVDAQGPNGGGTRNVAALPGNEITYQGQLKNNGALVNGTCDFQFGLWDNPNTAPQYGSTQTVSSLTIINGLFTTQLDFGVSAPNTVFTGTARYLAIAVRCPAGGGGFTTLSPREALTPAPMALALPGMYTQQNTLTPNVIGGYSSNFITPTIFGATISGGGGSLAACGITACPNQALAVFATVSGGAKNTASGNSSNIGGGYGNTTGGAYATIGGGSENTASGTGSVVGGGGVILSCSGACYLSSPNAASGDASTIPGGYGNSASGDYSFAAGRLAHAMHQGAFVWADSTSASFASSANDQYLIRASGGMGVGTNSPSAQLNVSSGGNVSAPQLRIDQTNSADYARLRFNVNTAANVWDIAVGDHTSNAMNFYNAASGNVMSLSAGSTHITMVDGATESGGNWTNASDRNAKMNFATVNEIDVLGRVANLPISLWSYKSEGSSIRHIGPMAQDFYSVFNLGQDDKHIGTVDEEGVALAAIQGLYQENQDLKARVAALESGNPVRASAFGRPQESPLLDSNAFGFGALLLSALALYRTQRKGAK